MSHSSENLDDAITQINVVPLVDIMLVLLIIFMLTASFISTPSLPVHVPKAYTADPAQPASQSLALSNKGELFYQGKRTDRDRLQKTLKEAAALNPELRMVVSADAATPNGKVVEVLDLVRQAGITKIALGVEKP